MQASNLRLVGKYADGAYRCIVNIDGDDCIYNARYGDNAPLNLWALGCIEVWMAAGNQVPAWSDPEPKQPEVSGVQVI